MGRSGIREGCWNYIVVCHKENRILWRQDWRFFRYWQSVLKKGKEHYDFIYDTSKTEKEALELLKKELKDIKKGSKEE